MESAKCGNWHLPCRSKILSASRRGVLWEQRSRMSNTMQSRMIWRIRSVQRESRSILRGKHSGKWKIWPSNCRWWRMRRIVWQRILKRHRNVPMRLRILRFRCTAIWYTRSAMRWRKKKGKSLPDWRWLSGWSRRGLYNNEI